jgi:hypothetical protein
LVHRRPRGARGHLSLCRTLAKLCNPANRRRVLEMILAKDFDFTDGEATQIRVAIETWGDYTTAPDLST